MQTKNHKITGQKSHDCHFLLHHLLELVVRRALPFNVAKTLIKLGIFFRNLCSKTITLEELDNLDVDIVQTLCKFEMTFPPSFFDIMIHLLLHLAHEVRLEGPVHFQWIYPIKRYDIKLII